MLNLDGRIAALKECPLFEELPREALRMLAMTCRPVLCPAGETVFDEGEEDTDAYLVVRGEARAFKELGGGRRMELGRFGPADLVGEFALLAGVPRTATVVASQDMEALCLGREALEEVVRAWPEVAMKILRLLVLRQLETRDQLLSLLAAGRG